MHCLTVIYPTPEDPAAFRDYYVNKHVPLAMTLPGLTSATYGFPEPLGQSDGPFCIFQAMFEDAAAMGAALASPIGARVAADVANYSPRGAQLSHYEIARA